MSNIDSSRVCEITEDNVKLAFKILCKVLKRFGKYGPISKIVRVIHAERHSYLDCQHIDFRVYLRAFGEDWRINIQVKSSDRHHHEFQCMCERKKLSIQCIVVKVGESIRSVFDTVVGCIFNALEKAEYKIAAFTKLAPKIISTKKKHRKQWCVRQSANFACH